MPFLQQFIDKITRLRRGGGILDSEALKVYPDNWLTVATCL